MPDPVNHVPKVPSDGVDPNVILPPSVLLARQASDTAYNAVYGQPNGEGDGAASEEGAPQPNGTVPAPNGAEGQPPAGDAPAEPIDNADGTPNWENRFKALKGRFDAEQRRSRETLEQYEERMRELARQTQRQPLPGENLDQPPVFISDKEKADYGEDLIELMKRAAQEAVMPMLAPIAKEVGTMRARVETTETETGRQFLQRMHNSMDNSVPGWQDLNKDPNFIAWTKRPDVYSGLNRQELLQRAWYAGDSNRVAAFFQGYLAEEAAVDPAAAAARQQANGSGNGGHAPSGPASPAQPPAPRVSLEQLAAPGRARAAATAPAGKPVWTAEGISQFYMDVAAGKFRGRDAERVATEADLMAAQREGRIQVNPRTATRVAGNQ
jgi:hypothetical protein